MKGKFIKFISLCLLLWPTQSRTEEITLAQAVDRALVHSPEIKVSEAELRAQGNKHVSSWLDLGPRLSGSYKHAFFDGKVEVPMGTSNLLVRDSVSQTGSLMVTQPMTALFALVQKARLEGKQKDLKETGVRLTRAQVAFKAAELYLRAQQSDRMWEISRASIEATQAQKKDGDALLRAERIHQGDLLKLELAVSQARSGEAKARATRDIARYTLGQMIGIDDPEALFLPALFAPVESPVESIPSLEEGMELSLQNRLELKQAQAGQEVASIAKIASFARFFPSVDFFAQVDRNFGKVSFGGAQQTKMLGINLSWEFWNNGSHIFQVREAAENMAKTLYQGDALKQGIRIDVMQARASLKAAQEGLALAKKAVEQANEAYRIEKLQFSAGKSSATQLVLAQTAKTSADGTLVSVFTDLSIQKIKLQQALGQTRPEL